MVVFRVTLALRLKTVKTLLLLDLQQSVAVLVVDTWVAPVALTETAEARVVAVETMARLVEMAHQDRVIVVGLEYLANRTPQDEAAVAAAKRLVRIGTAITVGVAMDFNLLLLVKNYILLVVEVAVDSSVLMLETVASEEAAVEAPTQDLPVLGADRH